MDLDVDDIYREINEASEDEVAEEITRLKRKRKGFRSAFTEILNIIDRLIEASIGADHRVNKSEDNRLAIQRASEKLERRYDKLQKLNHRIHGINLTEADDAGYQGSIDEALKAFTTRIDNLGHLHNAMLPNPNQQGAGGTGHILRPVEALKPSFSLSFDNSPTELSTFG